MSAKRADVPERIERLRKRLGVTREQLADLLLVSKMSIWRWQTGRSRPLPAHLRQIEELEKKTRRRA